MTSFFPRRSRRACVALGVLLAACGGDGRAEPEEGGERASTPAVLPAAQAAAAEGAPPPVARPDAPLPSPAEPPAPSRADSIAAIREDVSPEWKQRERQMGGYGDCIRQARDADGAVRERLDAICARLPDAPR